ncbi:alpha-tocopherol transfer protein-like [Bacillus rossius redtenbacheri]|uniref:alpha-tocopherol transfer protein-like n=1 Tax=Bacillus rossius redtenbacheri TaxID=93214 RepID=UPI002FDD84FF
MPQGGASLLQPPSPATQRRMRDKLAEDPAATRQHVAHLKEWLRQQPHLPDEDDEAFLEHFLYSCKNRLSRCKEVLDMYYTVRGAVPEFFKNRDATSKSFQECCEVIQIAVLPSMTPEGYRMFLMKLRELDPARFDVEESIKRAFMVCDLRLRAEKVLGDVHVYDATGVTWAHLMKYTPTILKKLIVCLQDAMPMRIKAVHFVNAPVFMDKFVAILKPFVKPKLRKRLFVHSQGVEALHEFYPAKLFPAEFGGTAPGAQQLSDMWTQKLLDERDWFLSEEKKMSDESKRLGKILDSGELFGMDGSFRKLSID